MRNDEDGGGQGDDEDGLGGGEDRGGEAAGDGVGCSAWWAVIRRLRFLRGWLMALHGWRGGAGISSAGGG